MLQWVIDLAATNFKGKREQNPLKKFHPFASKVKKSSVLVGDTLEHDTKFIEWIKKVMLKD